LLASDPDYYVIKTFDFDYEALRDVEMLVYHLDIDKFY
jgi:hypothetical protein